MSISVIVLSENAVDQLRHCIDSLVAVEGLEARRDQIIVVDNGSTDGSRGALLELEHRYPELVQGIYLCANHGTTTSRNLALAHARNDILLLLDPAIVFTAPLLAALSQRIRRDPTIGLITPRLIAPDGQVLPTVDVFPTVWRGLHGPLRHLPVQNGHPKDVVDGVRPVDYALSSFWLMRRELLSKVGLLDERIYDAREDVDYCLRVWLAGYRVVQATAKSVVQSTRPKEELPHRRGPSWDHIQGLAYLLTKHRYFLRRSPLYRRMPRHPCHPAAQGV